MRPATLWRGRRALASSFLVAVALLAAATDTLAAPSHELSLGTARSEFNAICADLTEARALLERGAVTGEDFGDRILVLFARADTLAALLAGMPRPATGPIGLQRGTAFLIDSLRENWLGIAAQNGMSFAEADLALKTAVAWRSSEAEGVPLP